MFWHFCAPLLSFMTCVWMLLQALRPINNQWEFTVHADLTSVLILARTLQEIRKKSCRLFKNNWLFSQSDGGRGSGGVWVPPGVPVSSAPFHCPTTCTLTQNWPWALASALVGMDWRPVHPLQDLTNGSLIIDSQQKTNGRLLKLLMNAAVTWNQLLLWGWSLISCVNQVNQANWWLQQHRSLAPHGPQLPPFPSSYLPHIDMAKGRWTRRPQGHCENLD